MYKNSLHKIKIIALFCAIAVLTTVTTGCSQGDRQGGPKGTITAVGSTAAQPLVEQAASQFMGKTPNTQIVVQGGGSGTGLSQVSQGAANIGNSDIFAEEMLASNDAAQLVDHQVAVVGMALIVNRGVTVDNITSQQLIDIFTGKITNWKELNGPELKIQLVNRPKGSGTRTTFKNNALKGAEEAKGIEQESSGTIRKIISETPGTISYVALPYLNDTVKTLKLDGVDATKENIISGKYPMWSYEHMYTKGAPTDSVKEFLDYMLSDEVQKTIIPKLGYISINEMQIKRDAKGIISNIKNSY